MENLAIADAATINTPTAPLLAATQPEAQQMATNAVETPMDLTIFEDRKHSRKHNKKESKDKSGHVAIATGMAAAMAMLERSGRTVPTSVLSNAIKTMSQTSYLIDREEKQAEETRLQGMTRLEKCIDRRNSYNTEEDRIANGDKDYKAKHSNIPLRENYNYKCRGNGNEDCNTTLNANLESQMKYIEDGWFYLEACCHGCKPAQKEANKKKQKKTDSERGYD